jgi:1,4-dihydroxy-2-naphthoyl-CoA hydrolase
VSSDDFTHRELLKGSPIGEPFAHVIRFQDVDAAGVVFYARLFDYFHDSYVVFLREHGHPLEQALATRAWAAPIKRAKAWFLRPLRFGDQVRTAIVASRVEGSDLLLGFRTELTKGEPAAIGLTHAVFVDLSTFERADPPRALAALFSHSHSAPG